MGICLQRYMTPDFAGHVANEIHVSATRNQWKFQIEKPHVRSRSRAELQIRGCSLMRPNSLRLARRATSVRRCGAPVTGSICASTAAPTWNGVPPMGGCGSFSSIRRARRLRAVNPHRMPTGRAMVKSAPDPSGRGANHSHFYRVQEDLPWRKLRNLRDLWTGAEPTAPSASSSLPAIDLSCCTDPAVGAPRGSLKRSTRLTRRDGRFSAPIAPTLESRTFNLPRTHTVRRGDRRQLGLARR